MSRDEAEELRIYHQARCEQQRRRVAEARSPRAVAAHAALLRLHELAAAELPLSVKQRWYSPNPS
jgi:hypothetical protein